MTGVAVPTGLPKGANSASGIWSPAFIGLSIFTFSIVTYRLPVGELGIAVALLGLIVQRHPLRAPAAFWLFLGFTLWSTLSGLASPWPPSGTSDPVWEGLKVLIIFYVALNTLRTRAQVRLYLLLLLGCFMLYPARGAIINYLGGYTIFGRALWNHVYANPNDLAALALIALGVSLSLGLQRAEHRYVRWGSSAAALLLLVVVLLTQSRGAFLGLVLGFGAAAWKFVKTRRSGLLAAAVVAATVFVAVPSSVWERLSGITMLTSTETIAQADKEGSAAQRYEIQKVAWEILQDNWLLGVGVGRYRAANAAYAPSLGARDTHNTYLRIAAETGVPGLLLWLAMVTSILRSSHRGLRAEQALRGSTDHVVDYVWIRRGLVAFLIAGFFGSYGSTTMPYIILAVLWCCARISLDESPRVQRAAATG